MSWGNARLRKCLKTTKSKPSGVRFPPQLRTLAHRQVLNDNRRLFRGPNWFMKFELVWDTRAQ